MSVARLYVAPTPFNAVELPEVDYTQSFDAIFFAHLNHRPNKLTRLGHTAWTFGDVVFGAVIPAPANVAATATVANTDAGNSGNAYFPRAQRYAVSAMDDDIGQESLPSPAATCVNDLTLKRNLNTVTWEAQEGADRYRVYRADLDGGFGYIGETDGTSFQDDNIIPDLTDGPRVGRDPFLISGDYPSTVFFVEQRLGYARTVNNPNALYLSRSADLENMDVSRPTQEDDAITIRCVATKVNAINQVVPLNDLLAFTSDGLFRIIGANTDYLAATPPPRPKRQNNRGSSRLKPVIADDVAFYAPAVGSDIRAANYTFEIDGYKSDNMSIFSPHFFENDLRIVAWAFADEPLSCIWAVRSDGALLCFTWEREQEVWGWTICRTEGRFLDVGVIPERPPGSTVAEHRVYFVVERVIDGVTRRFVERMASAKWQTAEQACFLDCAVTLTFDDPVTEAFVPHLAGIDVAILADGDVYSKRRVGDDGRVTISSPSRLWHVGLPYQSTIETLPLVMQTQSGYAAGKVKQLGEVLLRLVETRGVKVGRKLDDLYALKTRTREPLGDPKALLTGDYLAQTPALASKEATIFVVQANPLPMTVTAIFLDPIQNEA